MKREANVPSDPWENDVCSMARENRGTDDLCVGARAQRGLSQLYILQQALENHQPAGTEKRNYLTFTL